MSRQELKRAMGDLKINQPFQLRDSRPSFNPPVVKPTSGQIDLGLNRPLVKSTPGLNDLRLDEPEVKVTSGQINERSNQPGVKSTPGSGGSFMIPHQLFEYCQRMASTKKELIIFNCLLRYSLGFHRADCEASLSFISQWTGIKDKRNISKTLKRLLAKEVIQVKRDFNARTLQSTIYFIPIVEEYLRAKQPGVNSTSGQNDLGLNQPETRGRFNPSPEVDLTPKKENSNKNSNKTLSPELESYFEKLPERKRISERVALSRLELTYAPEEISKALAWVKKNGSPGSGETVHSPLAFLSTAMNDVLGRVASNEEKQASEQKLRELEKKAKAEEADRLAAEELLFQEASCAFEKAFTETTLREEKLEELISKLSFGRNLPEKIVRRLVILAWYKKLETA